VNARGAPSTSASGLAAEAAPESRSVQALKAFARPAIRERCELCALELGAEHPHLISDDARMLRCACVACSLLFDSGDAPAAVQVPSASAAVQRWRRVAPSGERLRAFQLQDGQWESLRIPIGLAYFTPDAEGRVRAFYPSPAGATESLLPLDAWGSLLEANPGFEPLQPLTEALLVNRMNGERAVYRVSIDHCFALVGTVRARWRGFTGGAEVWSELKGFFARLEGGRG
jgi:hypothetical protein